MTGNGILQIAIYFLLILALAKPVGAYMARLFNGERTFLHPILRPLERLCYAIGGVREDAEQRWTQYAGSLLSFSFFRAGASAGFVFLPGAVRIRAIRLSAVLFNSSTRETSSLRAAPSNAPRSISAIRVVKESYWEANLSSQGFLFP